MRLALVVILGLIFLLVGNRLETREKLMKVLGQLLRDLGIACIVAVVLGYGFDFYERERDKQRTREQSYDAMMADALTPEIWQGVHDQILKKEIARKDAELRLVLRPDATLPYAQMALEIEWSYDLYNLEESKQSVTVEHELGYELKSSGLPRFEKLSVDDGQTSKVYEGQDLNAIVKDGFVRIPIELMPRSAGSHVHIATKRVEIQNIPGSYNLYMNDYTKGIRVIIDKCPKAVDLEVRVRPEGAPLGVRKIEVGTWYIDSLMLPGQAIEFKFRKLAASLPTAVR